jgi:hypothetical protein
MCTWWLQTCVFKIKIVRRTMGLKHSSWSHFKANELYFVLLYKYRRHMFAAYGNSCFKQHILYQSYSVKIDKIIFYLAYSRKDTGITWKWPKSVVLTLVNTKQLIIIIKNSYSVSNYSKLIFIWKKLKFNKNSIKEKNIFSVAHLCVYCLVG